jgi:MFS transporter, SP family, arabinose:H+ symporter
VVSEAKAAQPSGRSVLEELDSRIPSGFYWYLAVLACIGGFLFGYDTSNIGSALGFIPYHLSSFATGYLVAGASLGAAVGALIAGPLTDRFGRKSLLVGDAAIYAVGAILSAVTINAPMLLGSRTLIGLAIGADSAIATSYIAEFAPRSRRGGRRGLAAHSRHRGDSRAGSRRTAGPDARVTPVADAPRALRRHGEGIRPARHGSE